MYRMLKMKVKRTNFRSKDFSVLIKTLKNMIKSAFLSFHKIYSRDGDREKNTLISKHFETESL